MMFIFPPIMYIRALKANALRMGQKADIKPITLNILLLLAGSGIGGYATLNVLRLIGLIA